VAQFLPDLAFLRDGQIYIALRGRGVGQPLGKPAGEFSFLNLLSARGQRRLFAADAQTLWEINPDSDDPPRQLLRVADDRLIIRLYHGSRPKQIFVLTAGAPGTPEFFQFDGWRINTADGATEHVGYDGILSGTALSQQVLTEGSTVKSPSGSLVLSKRRDGECEELFAGPVGEDPSKMTRLTDVHVILLPQSTRGQTAEEEHENELFGSEPAPETVSDLLAAGWSPIGDVVLFVTVEAAGDFAYGGLYVVAPPLRGQQRISDILVPDLPLEWTPAGNALAVGGMNRDGAPEAVIADPTTANVIAAFASASCPCWLPRA